MSAVISCHGAVKWRCPLYPRELPRQPVASASALGRFCCRNLLKVVGVGDSVAVMRFATGADHDGAAELTTRNSFSIHFVSMRQCQTIIRSARSPRFSI